jgi:hypothetical protein
VVREDDTRRINLPADLVDISVTGVGIITAATFRTDERIKLRLRNDVRRFLKEVHGVVRWAKRMDDGRYRVGIELNSRFTSLDMQLLRQVATAGEAGRKIWI